MGQFPVAIPDSNLPKLGLRPLALWPAPHHRDLGLHHGLSTRTLVHPTPNHCPRTRAMVANADGDACFRWMLTNCPVLCALVRRLPDAHDGPRSLDRALPSLPVVFVLGQDSTTACETHDVDPINSHMCWAASDNFDVTVNTRTLSPAFIASCNSA